MGRAVNPHVLGYKYANVRMPYVRYHTYASHYFASCRLLALCGSAQTVHTETTTICVTGVSSVHRYRPRALTVWARDDRLAYLHRPDKAVG